MKNVELHFRRIKKFRLWKAWQETRFQAYMKEKKKEESKDIFASIKQKRALQKWFLRTRVTLRFRTKNVQFIQRQEFRLKRMIFDALIFKKSVNNTMAKVMGNLENFMRTKMLDDSMKNIYSFALSKKIATNTFKRRATFDILSFLS